jgi:hypothetical protein
MTGNGYRRWSLKGLPAGDGFKEAIGGSGLA